MTAYRNHQIRKVPDDVHGILRTRAAAAELSLSDYALQELNPVPEHPTVADVLAPSQHALAAHVQR